ncbi:MAG: hypothetical protein ACJ0HZ_03865 [Woeseiaceae bacterium]
MKIQESIERIIQAQDKIATNIDFRDLQRELVDLNADGQYQTAPIGED